MKFGKISVERQGEEIVISADGMRLGDSGNRPPAGLKRAIRFFRWYVAHTEKRTVAVCEPHTARWLDRHAPAGMVRVGENVWAVN